MFKVFRYRGDFWALFLLKLFSIESEKNGPNQKVPIFSVFRVNFEDNQKFRLWWQNFRYFSDFFKCLTFFHFSNCRRHCLGSNLVTIGSEKTLHQDEDHSWNDPHLVPGFLYLSFGMSPERIRSESEPVRSEENRQVWRERPKCDSPFC